VCFCVVCVLQVKAEFACFLTWLIAFSIFMLLFQVGSSAVLVTVCLAHPGLCAHPVYPSSACNLHSAWQQLAVWFWC
jgi:hypothetical protein